MAMYGANDTFDNRFANPLWGAPRIHGELLKLGIEIGQTSVAKYIVRRRGERHLRYVLLSYKDYYNATRTHLSLNKGCPGSSRR